MNKNEFESKMKKFGDRQQDLANAMNLSLASTNAKINGKSKWTQSEISFIKDRYNLTPEEVIEIFFNQVVHQEGTVPRGT